MKKDKTKAHLQPSHVSAGNVIDDLGLTLEEAASLKLKMALHSEIMKIVAKRKIKPRELEKLLDQPQSRISELVNGKMSKMSAEKLVGYLRRLGHQIVLTSKSA